MSTLADELGEGRAHPVTVDVESALHDRNRLTSAFRIFLAIPHLLLVGGPISVGFWVGWQWDQGNLEWGAWGGVLGAVAGVVALIAWFAILFTGRYPNGLWDLMVFYLRWRVRAVAYTALLRDEYPPFGEAEYPASLHLVRPATHDRLTVAFRIILALPHIFAVWVLGMAWAITTMIAWFAIVFTGEYPGGLYDFGVGVLRWNTRVEAYLLLLRDEYPPFSLS